jgi:hypothetical protein
MAKSAIVSARNRSYLLGANPGEAGQRAVDQPAVEAVAGGGVQAEPGHDPGPEILDHDVRPG